jgi:hypothetical protein
VTELLDKLSQSSKLPLMLVTDADVRFNPEFTTKQMAYRLPITEKALEWFHTRAGDRKVPNQVYALPIIRFLKRVGIATHDQVMEELRGRLGRLFDEEPVKTELMRLIYMRFIENPPADTLTYVFVG